METLHVILYAIAAGLMPLVCGLVAIAVFRAFEWVEQQVSDFLRFRRYRLEEKKRLARNAAKRAELERIKRLNYWR